MNFLNPKTLWQAQNLPEGLSFSNGVISGSPENKGTYSPEISVSNNLGSDKKNITIIVKNRPGTEKFSILQNGTEIDKVTIPELKAMVQDGTAQTKYNCTNTQIIMPVLNPSGNTENVALNFCSFRNVTLEDGTTKSGLILQFDKTLWLYYAPFDTGDSPSAQPINRWRYSNLRQWLNSSGTDWFTPAYDGDALVPNPEGKPSYADNGSRGFLDLIHEDMAAVIQPIKLQTQAFFDPDNNNSSIEEPDYIDGYDIDITFDKVFIPSAQEMYLFIPPANISGDKQTGTPATDTEGAAWEYWIAKFGTDQSVCCLYEAGPSDLGGNTAKYSYATDEIIYPSSPVILYWGLSLSDPDRGTGLDAKYYTFPQQHVACRSAKNDSPTNIWDIYRFTYGWSMDAIARTHIYEIDDLYFEPSNNLYVSPAPAFTIY